MQKSAKLAYKNLLDYIITALLYDRIVKTWHSG